MEKSFKVGDIIKSTENLKGIYANRYGRIDEITTLYRARDFVEVHKILVTFSINGKKFQIGLPDDAYEQPEKYFEVVFLGTGS